MADGGNETHSPDHMREQRIQRNLKIVVGGLGALILVVLTVIAVKVASLATSPSGSGTASTVTATMGQPGGEIALEVPKGAKVVSISLSGNRLAVHHDGPGGTGISIVDLETGRRVVDVKPLEAVPRN